MFVLAVCSNVDFGHHCGVFGGRERAAGVSVGGYVGELTSLLIEDCVRSIVDIRWLDAGRGFCRRRDVGILRAETEF